MGKEDEIKKGGKKDEDRGKGGDGGCTCYTCANTGQFTYIPLMNTL